MKRKPFNTAYTFDSAKHAAEPKVLDNKLQTNTTTAGQAMSIQQLLQRHAQGIPLNIGRGFSWDDENDDPWTILDDDQQNDLTNIDRLSKRSKDLKENIKTRAEAKTKEKRPEKETDTKEPTEGKHLPPTIETTE